MASIPGFNRDLNTTQDGDPLPNAPTAERDGETNPTDPTRVRDEANATDPTAIRAHKLRLGFNYYVHQKYLKHLRPDGPDRPCHARRQITLDNGEPETVRLGRDYQNPEIDIYLVDMFLSRHMADIFMRNGQFCIRNKSATAKFLVDSIELKKDDVAEIWHRSRIRFSGLKFGEEHGLNYIEFICEVEMQRSSDVEMYNVEWFSDENAPLYRSVRRYIHSRAPWATRHNTDPPDPEFEEPFHTHMRIIEARRAAGRPWRNLDIDLIPKNPRNPTETRQPFVTTAEHYLWDFEEEPPPPDEQEDPYFPRTPQQYHLYAQKAKERHARNTGNTGNTGTPIPHPSSTTQQPFSFPNPTPGPRDDYAYLYGESGSDLSMLYSMMSNLASMRPETNGRQTQSMNYDRQIPGILRNMDAERRTRPNIDMFGSVPQNHTPSHLSMQSTRSMASSSVHPGGTERHTTQTNQSELPSLPRPMVDARANTNCDLIPFQPIFEADPFGVEETAGPHRMESHDSGLGSLSSQERVITNPNLPVSNRNDTETK